MPEGRKRPHKNMNAIENKWLLKTRALRGVMATITGKYSANLVRVFPGAQYKNP